MRDFPPVLLDLLDQGRVAYAGMIRFDLGEGSFGVIQSESSLTFQGITYQPVPRGLIKVSGSSLSTGTSAQGFQIELAESDDNGITPAVIMNFENYDYRDRAVTVFDQHVHPDTNGLLGNPIPQLRGYIDTVLHQQDESGYRLVLQCEDRGMDFNRMSGRFSNNQSQRRVDPNDSVHSNTAAAGRFDVLWGRD